MKVMESGEDYLETILMIRNRQGSVRSVDVANELGVSKSSVCTAMQNLLRGGYILMDRQRTITLTDSGEEIAKRVYERHLVFSEWLCALGVDRETALHDACRMEHAISAESFAALKAYLMKSGFLLPQRV